ncbi:MAG: sedoheptulose 7-phosphate cyclase [Actinomycetota bacterium]
MSIDMPLPATSIAPPIGRLIQIGEVLDPSPADLADLEAATMTMLTSTDLEAALIEVTHVDADDESISRALADLGAVEALGDLRRLRTGLTASTATVVGLLGRVLEMLAPEAPGPAMLSDLGRRLIGTAIGERRLLDALGPREWIDSLALTDPHSVAATSPYRRSGGHVVASDDDRAVEAVMTQETFTSLRVVDRVLDLDQPLLADMYAPLGRCVAFVDSNVIGHHGDALRAYFGHHGIELTVLVHRAMEVDKGVRTVEHMLGELKAAGVARHEPVLVMGGGVLADTAGLACALYHRSTPYVMLSTSLVAGIDAGPSPRTCCDGFGYKNLLGAYHPPILSITDRHFFASMPEGWLRHGLAEVLKMAIVDDAELFALLESVGPELVTTRFGTLAVDGQPDVESEAGRVIAAAVRSYVAAEYGNLYETHQLRPHAYGHTWSPGFEISAGLLHGHAVSIGMGFGAFLAHRADLLPERDMHRILAVISRLGLSTWHDVLDDHDLVWTAQERMVEKRGGQLYAPVPRGRIGAVGYLDAPTRPELESALRDYRVLATAGPRGGIGIEPHCRDVGLEGPATVGTDEPSIEAPVAPPGRPRPTAA